MALPDLIEIVPLDKPVRAEITVPGSKSITNRALILAALADGEVTLTGALWSEDTQIMVECLQKLGFEIRVENDPDEFCNRTITVKGLGGKIPNGGTAEKPLELFVGNAGTAARFLSAFVCLGNGVYRLSGVPRMHERPQAALFQALRELGYRVESENGNDKLPVKIWWKVGNENRKTEMKCTVSIEKSSQFASALLLCSKVAGWKVVVAGENAEESPYVTMTSKLTEVFPQYSGEFQIEPDASSGSYFWAVGRLLHRKFLTQTSEVQVSFWPNSGWQIDQYFPNSLEHFFGTFRYWRSNIEEDIREFSKNLSREKNTGGEGKMLGDSIMTSIILASLSSPVSQATNRIVKPNYDTINVPISGSHPLTASQGPVSVSIESPISFTDLERLRLQETERVVALRTELTKCGAKVVEEGDTLTVYPSQLHGAEIETYNDHRMAMCFAILGLKVLGIKIKNPACVKKTFPNFFQKLAAPPPKGLGATILDAKTGKKLTHEELFAD